LARPADRLGPQLAAAIGAAKKAKATLIIAKLDRLARNVHFISGLMESGVDFVAADNPHANKLMVHLLAAFAEHEREQISQRTKDALAAATVRGIRLGRNGADRLAPAYRAQALERACQLFPVLAEFKRDGMSARRMAAELTARGIPTPTGARWHAQTVLRILGRAGSSPRLDDDTRGTSMLDPNQPRADAA
jgi:DNA invertase Pin-like site-specific DNA recombinase